MLRPLALVTGASAGIGAELARRFAAAGCDLVLSARRADAFHTLAAEVALSGAACHVFPADLADPTAPERLFADVSAAGLTVDVLVNNAGFGMYGPFAAGDPAKLTAMLQVNVAALTHLTRLVLPGMVARGQGRVLTVASTAAFQPGPGMAAYYATKAFVLSLSEALSEEVRGTGVTVTCLCPGPTRTEFADAAGLDGTKLFSGPHVMAVGPVAAAGVRATLKGQRVVVPGLLNRVLAATGKFVPRPLLLRAVHRMQNERVK